MFGAAAAATVRESNRCGSAVNMVKRVPRHASEERGKSSAFVVRTIDYRGHLDVSRGPHPMHPGRTDARSSHAARATRPRGRRRTARLRVEAGYPNGTAIHRV